MASAQSDIECHNSASVVHSIQSNIDSFYLTKLTSSGPDIIPVIRRHHVAEVDLRDEALSPLPWSSHLDVIMRNGTRGVNAGEGGSKSVETCL